MKGIYLASFIAYHEKHNIVYQDIIGNRDIGGDMMDIDLSPYDYIIATPPCNYWSRANYRRETSEYALNTKHLLIDILHKLCNQDKPFIVENVRNSKMFDKYGLFDLPCYVYFVGRHTYWTNIKIDFSSIVQKPKTIIDGKRKWLSSQNISRKKRQGGEEVHEVIEFWLNNLEKKLWGNRKEKNWCLN